MDAELYPTIMLLIDRLSPESQRQILDSLIWKLRPELLVPEAGAVLKAVVALLRQGDAFTIRWVKQRLLEQGFEATNKEIYNAITYLKNKGKIQRQSYGKYIVQGAA